MAVMAEAVFCRVGILQEQRAEAAWLYDAAFGSKLALAIPDGERRRAMLADSLVLSSAVVAMAGDEVVGLAGFKTSAGGLVNITAKQLMQQLGMWAGLRAIIVFALYERERQADELLMDGIAVASNWRGRGIGTQLFAALQNYARDNSYRTIRLDVIDTNPAARRLYERLGFVAVKTQHFGYLRKWLGFGAATTMLLQVN